MKDPNGFLRTFAALVSEIQREQAAFAICICLPCGCIGTTYAVDKKDLVAKIDRLIKVVSFLTVIDLAEDQAWMYLPGEHGFYDLLRLDKQAGLWAYGICDVPNPDNEHCSWDKVLS